MRRFFLRWLNALRPNRAEEDLDRELSVHLALLEEEYRRRGSSPEEAHFAARRALGSTPLAKDLHRDTRSFVWIDDLRRDLGHTLRGLRRNPAFAALAVLALGLGIGVNTTFFTLVDAICLRGLPIDAPERVVYVSLRNAQGQSGGLSLIDFDDLRAGATSFAQLGAYMFTVAAVSDDRQPPARVPGAFISAGGLELLGDRPILGRTFRSDEDRPGGPAVVILGGEIWRSRYGADPAIVGQSITVNGVSTTVIGVMPRGFRFPANADLWRPMASLPEVVRTSRTERRLAVYARLAPEATLDQARADLERVDAAWARQLPVSTPAARLHAVPINEQLNPSVWQRAWLAFITAGVLVLLVACANVANLLLMRGAARGREMAIRASIGATRARVVRQLLVESAALAALAGTVGLTMAWIGLRILAGMVPPETLPYWMAFTIDGRVLAVTMAVCLGCVFVCGLPSALHVSRMDVMGTLTESSPTTMADPTRRWIGVLLTGEFAVTLVLASLAVLSVRVDAESRRSEFQIDPTNLLTMWVTLPVDSYAGPEMRLSFMDRLDEAVGELAVVESLAFASSLPYGGGLQQPLTVAGRVDDEPPLVSTVAVSERYFDVLGVPLVRGRAFTTADARPGTEAAIVNQRFVQMFFLDEDPIGVRIRLGAPNSPWLLIVGVVTTVRQQSAGAEADPVVYVPFRLLPPQTMAILVRTPSQSEGAVSMLRGEVARLDPNLPLYRVMTFEEALRNALWNARMSSAIVRSIAIVALLLAVIGLYAVTGHAVQRWRRELALRMALGARAKQIRWLVVRRVLVQLAVGLGVGLVGAQAFDRLFNEPSDTAGGVGMMDPGAVALVVLSILAVALVACLPPIHRAARVDPIVALRAD